MINSHNLSMGCFPIFLLNRFHTALFDSGKDSYAYIDGDLLGRTD